MGDRLVSLRGDGPWRGRSTRATSDRGDRRLIKIENGYVSGDGNEIRQFPGYKTICDLTAVNNQIGYSNVMVDMMLPYLDQVSDGWYFQDDGGSPGEQLTIRAYSDPKHIHSFHQVRGKLLLVGESNARKCPIYDSAREQQVLYSLAAVSASGLHRWQFKLVDLGFTPLETPTTAASVAFGANDGDAAGAQGLNNSDTVWIQGATVESGGAITQAEVDAQINGKFHRLIAISGSTFTLTTTYDAGAVAAETMCSAGSIYRTRNNRSNNYSPDGVGEYPDNPYDEIDDLEALTAWFVPQLLDTDSVTPEAYTSWVANRQRDLGDGWIRTAPTIQDGVKIDGSPNFHAISRRRQKPLDYRTNPEIAGNRLLLAAPGYGCLFQVPLIVPSHGEGWPAVATTWSPGGGIGVKHIYNDLHDKPRALGVPKAVLLSSTYPDAMASPSAAPATDGAFNFAATMFAGDFGLPPNYYRVAISYEDEFTGEEGLASEILELDLSTVPAGTHCWILNLHYMHPGYLMPECLAMKVNIYLGVGANAPLGYLRSVRLKPHSGAAQSAKYGFEAGTTFSPASSNVFGTLGSRDAITTSPDSDIVYTRLAPRVNQMPHGAEAVRYIRGILLSTGNLGTHGLNEELRYGTMSALRIYSPSSPSEWQDDNTIVCRGLTSDIVIVETPTTDDGTEEGPWGLASNWFPAAYQGSKLWAFDLFPQPRHLLRATFTQNHRSHNSNPTSDPFANRALMHAQPIRLEEDALEPYVSPTHNLSRKNKGTYHVLPRGQVQIGEPGDPSRALSTEIQFLDPNVDDDGFAIGNLSGSAIICSRKETFSLSWHRAPKGQIPQLISNEFGCIATNSMVQYDGGLAWISERGPVAIGGQGFEFVGHELEDDFHGNNRRYLKDTNGLMRHCWGVHDRSRGLVMWGMVTTDATHTMAYRGSSATFANSGDQARSRFPCDEVLIWSYRANAFSTWRPPSGLEVLWMNSIVDGNGDTRMAFLAADTRIYVLDDTWQDSNISVFLSTMPTAGSGTTFQSSVLFGMDAVGAAGGLARGSGDNFVRIGMTCVLLNGDQVSNDGHDFLKYKGKGVIVSATPSTQQIDLDTSLEWNAGDIVLVGVRAEMTVETTYLGQGVHNMSLDAVQMRHGIATTNSASPSYAKIDVLRTSRDVIDPVEVGMSNDPLYEMLGRPIGEPRVGFRRAFNQGKVDAPEVSVRVKVIGAAQVRISDLLLEVG
jgi:hypothetical protein